MLTDPERTGTEIDLCCKGGTIESDSHKAMQLAIGNINLYGSMAVIDEMVKNEVRNKQLPSTSQQIVIVPDSDSDEESERGVETRSNGTSNDGQKPMELKRLFVSDTTRASKGLRTDAKDARFR